MSNDFVNRLISIRKAYGKSGYAFSRMLNIPQPSYLRYETGEQKPSAKLLIGLNKFCNVNINWLLTGQGEQFLPNNSLRNEALVQSQTQDLDNSLRNWVSRLNIVLEENNLNYGDFANLIDISHKRLDNLTSKKELPNFEELTKIKSNFNVSLDWLLYGGDFGDVQANNSNSLLTEEEIDAFKNVINKLNQSYLSTFSAKDMKKLKV